MGGGIPEYLSRVGDRLKRLLDPDALSYVSRHEKVWIDPDYGLRVVKDVELKSKAGDVSCYTSGWVSYSVPARLEDVRFDISVLDSSGREAVYFPIEDRPHSKRLMVCLIPPLQQWETVQIRTEWQWPQWWQQLKKKKKDVLKVNLPGPVKDFSIQFYIADSICEDMDSLGKIEVVPAPSSKNLPIRKPARSKWVEHIWSCGHAKRGAIEFLVSFPAKE
ncbi:MAG: hypothetical protein O7H41_21795 [Planctomycetota bacterium]|nr:hypothetical protein [Planctomycetota bacterium]